jgi:D-lactate dehydrogenase (cytochrome)
LPKIKNTAGYMCAKNMDLIDLFIGSEGTLGVISEATLKLIKKPGNIGTLISYFNSEDNAITFASLLNEDTNILSTEFFDSNSLSLLKDDTELAIKEHYAAAILTDFFYKNDLDLEHIGNRLENKLNLCKSNLGNTSLGIHEKEIEKIHNIRHKLPERINVEIAKIKKKFSSVHKIGTDTAVPQSSFKQLLNNYHVELEKSRLPFVIFGHIGESHIHVNIIPKNKNEFQKGKKLSLKLANIAIKLDGTVSAEHGIGKLKRNLLPLMFPKEQITSMVTIKKLFDPNNILSKGNMFSIV